MGTKIIKDIWLIAIAISGVGSVLTSFMLQGFDIFFWIGLFMIAIVIILVLIPKKESIKKSNELLALIQLLEKDKDFSYYDIIQIVKKRLIQ